MAPKSSKPTQPKKANKALAGQQTLSKAFSSTNKPPEQKRKTNNSERRQVSFDNSLNDKDKKPAGRKTRSLSPSVRNRTNDTLDLTSSPQKKKLKSPSAPPDATMCDEHGVPLTSPSVVPPTPSMKEAALAGTSKAADGTVLAPVFAPNPGTAVIRKHKRFLKVALRIDPRPSKEADPTMTDLKWLQQCIGRWLDQIQQDVDPSIVLFQYVPTDPEERNAVKRASDLPRAISGLRKYVGKTARASKTTEKYMAWLDIRLGCDEPMDQVIDDLKQIGGDDIIVTSAPLQVPYAQTPSFLLRSHEEMNETYYTKLLNGFFRQIDDGKATMDNCPRPVGKKDPLVIALKYKTVFDGISAKEAKKLNIEKERISAVNIVCKPGEEAQAVSMVQWALGTKTFKRLNTLDMMVVPCFDRDGGPDERTKIRDSLDKQKKYADQVYSLALPNWKRELDVKNPKTGKTLRHLLMAFKHTKYPKCPLFFDVNMTKNNDAIRVSFPQKFSEDARFKIKNAAAYLFHSDGDDGLYWFNDGICQTVKTLGWNEETNRPKTANEELYAKALKTPEADSRLGLMFDLSEMDKAPAPLTDGRPSKDAGSDATSNAPSNAFSGITAMSKFYDDQGRKLTPTARVQEGESLGGAEEDSDEDIYGNESSATQPTLPSREELQNQVTLQTQRMEERDRQNLDRIQALEKRLAEAELNAKDKETTGSNAAG